MEDFKFVFVAMGQGDCTLIRCPDGKVVVIDCGTSNAKEANPKDLQDACDLLRTPEWAGGQENKVAALILTHSDKDHYNKVVKLLGQGRNDASALALKVARVYISNGPESTSTTAGSPLYYYKIAATNVTLGSQKVTDEIYDCLLSEAEATLRKWPKVKAQEFKFANYEEVSQADKMTKILAGTTPGGTPWSVTILAGNVKVERAVESDEKGRTQQTSAKRQRVAKSKSPETSVNAGSLVTLFKIGDSKALLCGDATATTEAYLIKTHGELIKNVNLVTAAHHGSAGSSTQAFVNVVKPRAVMVSVSDFEHSFFLPREEVLKRWLAIIDKPELHIADHDIFFWKEEEAGKDATVAKWDADGNVHEADSKNRFYRCRKPYPADVVALYYRLNDICIQLGRKTTNLSLTMTSQQTQACTLSATGLTYEDVPTAMVE